MLLFVVIPSKKRLKLQSETQNEYFLLHLKVFPRITVYRVQKDCVMKYKVFKTGDYVISVTVTWFKVLLELIPLEALSGLNSNQVTVSNSIFYKRY